MAKDSYTRSEQRRRKAKRYITHEIIFFWGDFLDKDKIRECKTNEEYWALKDSTYEEETRFLYRQMDRSRWNGYGKKGFKKPYHRLRRQQARQLSYYALYEDEERFDKIVPDGFRGSISWDIC